MVTATDLEVVREVKNKGIAEPQMRILSVASGGISLLGISTAAECPHFIGQVLQQLMLQGRGWEGC